MQTSDVILHVGYPKAASTWLQRCVFIPEFGFQSPWPTHDNLAIEHFVLTPKPVFDPDTIRESFLSACSDGAAPVISHEVLVGDPTMGRYHGFESAERLAATFPGARVIVFFRAQETYAYSAWSEHVRRGGVSKIDAFIGADNVPPGYRPFCPHEFLKYDLLIGFYKRLFGGDRVLALPMEALRDNQAIPQLSRFLNNEQLLACENRPVYESDKGATTRILRNLNRFNPYDPTQRTDRSFLGRQSGRLNRRLPQSWHDKSKRSDQEKFAQLLAGRFGDSNRRLQEMTPLDLSRYGYQL